MHGIVLDIREEMNKAFFFNFVDLALCAPLHSTHFDFSPRKPAQPTRGGLK